MSLLTSLPAGTVAQLRSGQVITSPSSAVKELVENAIDAGATNIDVKLDDYGMESIEVKDNGCGVSKPDLKMMAAPHATSKISSFEDLSSDALHSYGFRGEALNSLCSVSAVVEVITKTAYDRVATCVTFDKAGNPSKESSMAGNLGTAVRVKQLFANVPVRRSYFRQSRSRKEDDFRKVKQLIFAYSLIRPQLRISLTHNRKEIYRKLSNETVQEAAEQVFGPEVMDSLQNFRLELEDSEGSGSSCVEMILSKNDQKSIKIASHASSDRLFIFVNDRPVTDKHVEKVVKKFFPSDRHPIGVLRFIVPSDKVDVNVEPNKMSVFIRNKDNLVTLVERALADHFARDKNQEDQQVNPTRLPDKPDQGKNGLEEMSRADDENRTPNVSFDQSAQESFDGNISIGCNGDGVAQNEKDESISIAQPAKRLRLDDNLGEILPPDEDPVIHDGNRILFGPTRISFVPYVKASGNDKDATPSSFKEPLSLQNRGPTQTSFTPPLRRTTGHSPSTVAPSSTSPQSSGSTTPTAASPLPLNRSSTSADVENSICQHSGSFRSTAATSPPSSTSASPAPTSIERHSMETSLISDVTEHNASNFVSLDQNSTTRMESTRSTAESSERSWSRGNCITDEEGNVVSPISIGLPRVTGSNSSRNTNYDLPFCDEDFVVVKQPANLIQLSPPRSLKKTPNNFTSKKRNSVLDASQPKVDEIFLRCNSSTAEENLDKDESKKNISSEDSKRPVQTRPKQSRQRYQDILRRAETVEFSLEKLNEFNVWRSETKEEEVMPSKKHQLIGQLPSNGFWLFTRENEVQADSGLPVIHVLNHFRLLEVTFFRRLMRTQSLPSSPLLKGPLDLFAAPGWDSNLRQTLLNLAKDLPRTSSSTVELQDPRFSLNGLVVQVKPDWEQAMLTHVANVINFMGNEDVLEVTRAILKNPDVSVENCRPLKIKNYLMAEANRLMRQSPPGLDFDAVDQLLDVQHRKQINQCLHFKPIVHKILGPMSSQL